ncbi:efflux RND transporter periplasmic adaptor subunit [Aquibacillus saliphilus]|uniref:efflux RND transporter periplasmic adaptor subunit n=1 Tax=Aquibacillus saliphilus TaxID=1909422 RepID=UPI001CF04AC4|nr:HlyD family efflux transporter periplasmic adaptor subunit [Aquibacillus saliphilus]
MKKKHLVNEIKSKRNIVVFLLIILILPACSLLPKEEEALAPPLVEPAQIDYETNEATIKEIVKRVNGVGNMIPSEQQNLFYAESGGRIDEVHVKVGDQVEEGQVLVEMETGNLGFDIQQAQIDLKKANLHLEQLQEQGADTFQVAIAKLDIQSVEIRLVQMRQQVAAAKLVSPINGFITFVGEKVRGDYVDAFEDLIQVADPAKLQLLYTATSPRDLNEVNVGMPVDVTILGTEVKGEVVQTPSDVPVDLIELNPDLYQRSLTINVEELPEGVEVGDVADFEIILQKKDEALTIPRSALRSAFGREYVHVLDGETKREVDIEKGIVSATEVEVLKGLEEGDRVILK